MTSRFVCVALCTRHSSCLRRGCRLHCCYWLYCWLSKVFSLPSHSVRIEMWDDKLCHITNTLTITNVRCHLTFDVGVPFQNKTICKQLWMFRKRRRQKINIYTYTYIYLDNIAVRVCVCMRKVTKAINTICIQIARRASVSRTNVYIKTGGTT